MRSIGSFTLSPSISLSTFYMSSTVLGTGAKENKIWKLSVLLKLRSRRGKNTKAHKYMKTERVSEGDEWRGECFSFRQRLGVGLTMIHDAEKKGSHVAIYLRSKRSQHRGHKHTDPRADLSAQPTNRSCQSCRSRMSKGSGLRWMQDRLGKQTRFASSVAYSARQQW